MSSNSSVLVKSFVCWATPKPRGLLENAQCIVAQACGDLPHGRTSETNRLLAQCIADLHGRLALPILVQGEVATPLDLLGVPVLDRTPLQATANPLEEEYLNSHDVAVRHYEICKQRRWQRVIIVGYVPHIWRISWIYEHLGLETIIPAGLPRIVFEPFEQKRLSHPLSWYSFELAARLVFLLRGWV